MKRTVPSDSTIISFPFLTVPIQPDSAPELPLPYVHKAKRRRDKTSNQVLLPLSYVPQGPRALNCYFPSPILRTNFPLPYVQKKGTHIAGMPDLANPLYMFHFLKFSIKLRAQPAIPSFCFRDRRPRIMCFRPKADRIKFRG